MLLPLAEGSLSRFLEVPLVLQAHTLCLYGKCHGTAKLCGLADRLLRDGKLLGYGDGNGVGLGCISQSVGDNAIELNSIPCDARSAGLG